ncbi:MAG TPA: dihydrofolate reductase family protein [Chitinophagaceae bacterium]|nr:dihydrofolate reductase family protein [Chitinophagaceae bacterium]
MKTTVYIGTSLDGFIARKDGDIDWLTQFANDEAIHAYEEFISRIDAIVIGRGTFEKVLTFPSWPYEQKAFLLSSSIKQVPDNLREKITLLSMKPKELLNYLSSNRLSRIYVDGGKVIQEFLKEDLIDELIISKVPILIGSGIPLFDYLDTDLQFKHIQTQVSSNGLVRSYYERQRK